MARYVTTVSSPAPAQVVFEYLADFANTASWDPSITSGELLSGEPGRAGARYRITVGSLVVTKPLEYVILESAAPTDEEPGRVVLEANTSDFCSHDVITVTPTASGCDVTYDADLALHGFRRPFDPFLRIGFSVVGNRARAGLRDALRREILA